MQENHEGLHLQKVVGKGFPEALGEKEKRLSVHSQGWLLDGFPRTIPQAEGLDYLLKRMKEQLDHVIVMDVPDNLIITRLSNRRSCNLSTLE